VPPVTVSVDVDRPAAEVYAYATDPSRFAEWQRGVVSGRTEPSDGDGRARCVMVRRIGFAERASTSDVEVAEPPRAWRVRGTDGPIRAVVDVTVVPLADDSSRITIAVDFEGHGVGRALVPLVVRPAARREMPANLDALKQHLEGARRSA
jgi:carbon monoxide dehydrogenase subunit G